MLQIEQPSLNWNYRLRIVATFGDSNCRRSDSLGGSQWVAGCIDSLSGYTSHRITRSVDRLGTNIGRNRGRNTSESNWVASWSDSLSGFVSYGHINRIFIGHGDVDVFGAIFLLVNSGSVMLSGSISGSDIMLHVFGLRFVNSTGLGYVLGPPLVVVLGHCLLWRTVRMRIVVIGDCKACAELEEERDEDEECNKCLHVDDRA